MKFLLSLVLLVFTLPVAAQKKPAPPPPVQRDFIAVTMDGAKIDTAALRGKIVVLNNWFINCPNCLEEIKLLNALVDEYKDNKDVVFVALAASRKADLEKFLKKNPFKYQVVPDAQSIILGKFGIPGKNGMMSTPFPMHFVLDREGNITAREEGTKGVAVVRNELKRQLAAKAGGSL